MTYVNTVFSFLRIDTCHDLRDYIYMDKIKPFDKMSRTEYITREIERLVLSDIYKEMDKLPSQSEFAVKFNVGTRTVREALKNLETKGLITIEQGKGNFVKKKNLDFYLQSLANTFSYELPHNKKILLDLTKTRELLECNAAKTLLDHPEVLTIINKLEKIVDEMEKYHNSNDLYQYRELDILFHQTLIGSTENEVIIYLYKHLTNLMLYSIMNTESLYNFQGFQEHKEIIKALKEQDVKKATAVIKDHLKHTYHTLETLVTVKK